MSDDIIYSWRSLEKPFSKGGIALRMDKNFKVTMEFTDPNAVRNMSIGLTMEEVYDIHRIFKEILDINLMKRLFETYGDHIKK